MYVYGIYICKTLFDYITHTPTCSNDIKFDFICCAYLWFVSLSILSLFRMIIVGLLFVFLLFVLLHVYWYTIFFFFNFFAVMLLEEGFGDTKRVIRIRKSKKDR